MCFTAMHCMVEIINSYALKGHANSLLMLNATRTRMKQAFIVIFLYRSYAFTHNYFESWLSCTKKNRRIYWCWYDSCKQLNSVLWIVHIIAPYLVKKKLIRISWNESMRRILLKESIWWCGYDIGVVLLDIVVAEQTNGLWHIVGFSEYGKYHTWTIRCSAAAVNQCQSGWNNAKFKSYPLGSKLNEFSLPTSAASNHFRSLSATRRRNLSTRRHVSWTQTCHNGHMDSVFGNTENCGR